MRRPVGVATTDRWGYAAALDYPGAARETLSVEVQAVTTGEPSDADQAAQKAQQQQAQQQHQAQQ